MIKAISMDQFSDVVPRRRARPTPKRGSNYAGKVVIRHVVEAARKNGIDVGGIEVSQEGIVRVFDIRAIPEQPADEFERWDRANRL